MPLPFLRYDGKMMGCLQFTEYDETLPSYRTTFVVPSESYSVEALKAKRAAKVEQFTRCGLL